MTPLNLPDTIIAEIHATRRGIYEKFQGDLNAIVEDALRRQAQSARPTWKQPVKSGNSTAAVAVAIKQP